MKILLSLLIIAFASLTLASEIFCVNAGVKAGNFVFETEIHPANGGQWQAVGTIRSGSGEILDSFFNIMFDSCVFKGAVFRCENRGPEGQTLVAITSSRFTQEGIGSGNISINRHWYSLSVDQYRTDKSIDWEKLGKYSQKNFPFETAQCDSKN